MSQSRKVWTDEEGDLRKAKAISSPEVFVNEELVQLKLRRLTSGKGRTVVEIKGLPLNKKWNQQLAKELKKSLGVGGSYKNEAIEVHGEKLDQVIQFLDSKSLKLKKTGG